MKKDEMCFWEMFRLLDALVLKKERNIGVAKNKD